MDSFPDKFFTLFAGSEATDEEVWIPVLREAVKVQDDMIRAHHRDCHDCAALNEPIPEGNICMSLLGLYEKHDDTADLLYKISGGAIYPDGGQAGALSYDSTLFLLKLELENAVNKVTNLESLQTRTDDVVLSELLGKMKSYLSGYAGLVAMAVENAHEVLKSEKLTPN